MGQDHKQPIALNLIPRAGDEILGLPAALEALTEAGWQVVHLLVDAGATPEQRKRHSRQADKAAAVMDSMLMQFSEPLILPGDYAGEKNGQKATHLAQLQDTLAQAFDAVNPALVISPSPQDDHPAGQQLGWVVIGAIENYAKTHGLAPSWWMWSMGAGTPQPNMTHTYGHPLLEKLMLAAKSYRDDLPHLGDILANKARLTKLIIEPTESDPELPYAERWMEVHLCGDLSWRPGPVRQLDPQNPLADDGLGENLRSWLQSEPMPRNVPVIQHTDILA